MKKTREEDAEPEAERFGKETHGQKKIKQKVRSGAGKKSQKNLCLIG